jgi:GTP-binding protein
MHDTQKIRNVAVVAHIDHGKTTLLDAMLADSKIYRENQEVLERALDSNALEKERGITIFAKHTSLIFEDYKINIIDTPGHADFSGEVERVLGMVNTIILLIDAAEGPKPQTRSVLSQGLKLGLKPLVVINKIDKPHADPDEALNKTFDLFTELGATDEQLDFPYCYASSLHGFAMKEIDDPRVDMRPLFEMIIDEVAPPPGSKDNPFLCQAATLTYNDYTGRAATGRILEGHIKKGDVVALVNKDGDHKEHKVIKIEGYLGLEKIEVNEAIAGDIVNITTGPEVTIGDTLCDPENIKQLPPIDLEKPTLSVNIFVNTSPFVGQDGKHVTMNKIKARLIKERKANISLVINEVAGRDDAMQVSGRGELHLSVLIETMRREGFEFSVSKPQVIEKEVNGQKHEPYELAHIEVKEEDSGSIIEEMNKRRGEMRSFTTDENGLTTLIFLIPTRGLMGFRSQFLTMTKGQGVLTSAFSEYGPKKQGIPQRKCGSLIANEIGRSTPYSIFNLQGRGIFFIGPQEDIYEGMVVGEHSRDNDLVVNVCKGKQLTNVRASGTDENVILVPPRKLTLESAIDFIQDDELIEVTPNLIRIRKIYLKETDRKRYSRAK